MESTECVLQEKHSVGYSICSYSILDSEKPALAALLRIGSGLNFTISPQSVSLIYSHCSSDRAPKREPRTSSVFC